MNGEKKTFALQNLKTGEVIEVVALNPRDALHQKAGMVALSQCNGVWESGNWKLEAPTERFWS
jgi:hypothetical protein